VTAALGLAERGVLPDAAMRAGIRRLLERQLGGFDELSAPELESRVVRLVDEMGRASATPRPAIANEPRDEIPADLFALVLGPRLKYSCCHWGPAARTLADAEDEALAITAERAQLADGAAILDLGCGWGSLSLWAAERFPHARILAVSNSRMQRAFVEGRARELGLSNLRVLTADANELALEEKFDRVVSVEMFEHLHDWSEMLRRIASWLVPGGRVFLHVFCHRAVPYAFTAERPDDWMGRHFFTEGLMPSELLLDRFDADLAVEERWRWSGMHYRKTAEAWLANLDSQREKALEILRNGAGNASARVRLRRWRMFFLACAELFGARGGNEWLISHARLSCTSSRAR
jgi:cyclopropane-fatty-acyl-phospholipid synthase